MTNEVWNWRGKVRSVDGPKVRRRRLISGSAGPARSVSVSRRVYERLRAYSVASGVSQAEIVDLALTADPAFAAFVVRK